MRIALILAIFLATLTSPILCLKSKYFDERGVHHSRNLVINTLDKGAQRNQRLRSQVPPGLLKSSKATYGTEAMGSGADRYEIETYRLDDFPGNKTSVHFGCKESDIFATNCACHIRCNEGSCAKPKEICYNLRNSHGCKYVLLRGPPDKQIATLKRQPTEEELSRWDTSDLPDSTEALQASSIWRSYQELLQKQQKQQSNKKSVTFGDFVSGPLSAGPSAKETLAEFMKNGNRDAMCVNSSAKGNDWERRFLASGISVVALSYRTPRSLLNSMKTWASSGLLDVAAEKLVILNDPLPQELAMSMKYGFIIHEPKDFATLESPPDSAWAGTAPHGKDLVRMSKPNVVTIGAAFAAAMKLSSSEYVLFLEKDFKMDLGLSREQIQAQLLGAAGMLDRGHDIIRLLSRKGKGCGTFKECGHGWHPSPNANGMDRKRNWYSFYCPGYTGSEPYVKDCLGSTSTECDSHYATRQKEISTKIPAECVKNVPRFRCFTSWDSNWSVNAVLVKRETMLQRKYTNKDGRPVGPLAALGRSFWQQNDGFESSMGFGLQWMNWKVPMCISFDGLFLHEEVETGA